MSAPLFIERLTLKNFKSFRYAQVKFDNPLFLVGRNGSGKSNLLDALSFVSDCARMPLRQVFEQHGGSGSVATRYTHSPDPRLPIEIRVDFLSDRKQSSGHFAVSIEAPSQTSSHLRVLREQLVVRHNNNLAWYKRDGFDFYSSEQGIYPSLSEENLVLPALSGIAAFFDVYKMLSEMIVYDIDANSIAQTVLFDAANMLDRRGTRLGGVLKHIEDTDADTLAEVVELLSSVSPKITSITSLPVGNKTAFLLSKDDLTFNSSEASRGTLSALGLIVATLQSPIPPLLAFEEPEVNLHPGVMNSIATIIESAAQKTQVVVATHSPDLLDAKWIKPENIRVVFWEDQASHVAELGIMPKRAMQEHLHGKPWYAGQLMRTNALDPAISPLDEQVPDVNLFEDIPK